MNSPTLRRGLLSASAALLLTSAVSVPSSAIAVTIWADWSVPADDEATASFPDGRSAVLTLFPVGGIVPANTGFTVQPDLPGIPGGGHPSYPNAFTGSPHPIAIAPDDIVLSLDLTGFPVDAETTFGLIDLFFDYRIELFDVALDPLPLDGLILSQFNVFYLPPSSATTIGDYDVSLDTTTGLLSIIEVHDADAGSDYRHSGLVLFENLPPDTALVRLVSDATQNSEGIRFLFGATSVPEPSAAMLLAFALALLVARRKTRLRL